MMRRRLNSRRSRGQSLAEFALVIPVFLVMLFGIIDLGRVIWANDALANAAREGARWASVHGDAIMPGHTLATKAEIKDYTRSFATAVGQNITVTVCYSVVDVSAGVASQCSGDSNQPSTVLASRGNLVTVEVSSTVPILTGSLLGMGDFHVSGSSTVLVNN